MLFRNHGVILVTLACLFAASAAQADDPNDPVVRLLIVDDPNNPPAGDAVDLSATIVGPGGDETANAGQAAIPQPGESWSAVKSEVAVAEARSDFRVVDAHDRLIATLSQFLYAEDPNDVAQVTGTGQMRIFVDVVEGTPPCTNVKVQWFDIITATAGTDADVRFEEGGPDLLTGTSYTNTHQEIYRVMHPGGAGGWVPLSLDLESSGTVNGTGSAYVRRVVVVSILDHEPDVEPIDPDVTINNEHDDEVPPDEEDECKVGDTAGGGLHMRIITGAVWTHVPIFRTYAAGDTELDFELRYNSIRFDQDGPVGYGWTHSYNVFLSRIDDGDKHGWIYWQGDGRRNFFQDGLPTPAGRAMALDRPNKIVTLSDGTKVECGHEKSASCYLVTCITDAHGRKTEFSYDAQDRLSTITSAHGRMVTLTYNVGGDHRIDAIQAPIGTTYLGYTNGQLTSVTDPEGNTQSFGYTGTSMVRLTSETLKNGVKYEATYESDSRAIEVVYGTPETREFIARAICPAGFPDTVEDERLPGIVEYYPNGDDAPGAGFTLPWVIHYNTLGQMTDRVAPGGATRSYRHYGLRTDDDFRHWSISFRLYKIINEMGGEHTIGYGGGGVGVGLKRRGEIASVTDAAGHTTNYFYEYDSTDEESQDYYVRRLQQRLEPDGDEWEYVYAATAPHDLIEVIDPLIESPDGTMTYAYTKYGPTDGMSGGMSKPERIETLTVTDRNGNTTVYAYDYDGDLSSVTRPLNDGTGRSLLTEYTHDAMGRLLSKTIHRSDTVGDESITTWTYDDMGRVLTREQLMGLDPALLIQYQYDDHGNLLHIIDPRNVKTTFEYDHRNRHYRTIRDDGTGVENLNLTTEWEFDLRDNVVKKTDAHGFETTYGYDLQDRLTRITDALSYHTRLDLDALGRVTSVERDVTLGGAETYEVAYDYDAIGRELSETVDPDNLALTTTFEYSPPSGCGSCSGATPGFSIPNKIVDPAGKITYLEYDALDRMTHVIRQLGELDAEASMPETDPDDAVSSYEFDAMGNLLKWVGPENETFEYGYDGANRRRLTRAYTNLLQTESYDFTYDYDGAHNLTTLTRPDGNIVDFEYDLANRLTAVDDLHGALASFTYDAAGNALTRSTGLAGQTWQFQYDAVGRVARIYDPVLENPDQFTTLDYHGDALNQMLVEVTDRNGIRTLREFDGLGRLIEKLEDYGGTGTTADTSTSYTYNGVALTALSDHNGNTTTYAYDAALRLTDTWYPDDNPSYPLHFEYDAAGNITQRVDQNLIVTNYTYDDLHQLASRTYYGLFGPDSRVETFAFNRSGRLCEANKFSPGGTPPTNFTPINVAFTYDVLGRPESATQTYHPGESTEAAYTIDYDHVVDNQDLRTIRTYPSGREVTLDFDHRSRLVSVYDDLDVGVEWEFDDGNRRQLAHLSNGVESIFAYDLNNRLTRVQHAQDAASVTAELYFHDVEYGYDPVGNRIWKRDIVNADRSELYQYDARDRLIRFERGTFDTSEPPQIQSGDRLEHPQLAGLHDWTALNALDSRGNWLTYTLEVDGAVSNQTRTLADPDGESTNEYDRVELVAPTGKRAIQELTYDEAGNLVLAELIGDMNCDGDVTLVDISIFSMALSDPEAYATAYPDCAIEMGDVNGDGQLTIADINAFATLVSAGLLEARQYDYDEENRLIAVRTYTGDELLEIEYDALGRRVFTIDYTTAAGDSCGDTTTELQTRHIYARLEVIEEHIWCDSVGPSGDWVLAREYMWGDRFPETLVMIDHTQLGDPYATGPEVLQYVHDALGNVVALTDAGDPDATPQVPAAVVERYTYEPYGQTHIEAGDGTPLTESAYGNPFAWTGQRYDPGVGLYHFLSRSYSPELGRWLQRDPLEYVDGPNLYQYVASMPTVLVDPLGLEDSPPSNWPKPPGWTKDWKWKPNPLPPDGRPGDADPGHWRDPEYNKWRFHPEDETHNDHWDKRPRKGKKERVPIDDKPPIKPKSDQDKDPDDQDPQDPEPKEPEKPEPESPPKPSPIDRSDISDSPSIDGPEWIIITILVVVDVITVPSGEGIIPALAILGWGAATASGDDGCGDQQPDDPVGQDDDPNPGPDVSGGADSGSADGGGGP